MDKELLDGLKGLKEKLEEEDTDVIDEFLQVCNVIKDMDELDEYSDLLLGIADGLDEEDTARWYEEKRIETEAALLEEREKQIICSELGNIMEELGYHVIAEKETVRKSGKHIKENIFSFGEGTAVNITEAGGQITMEVVGLDTSTRMPEEAEQDYLEEEMVSFCSAHKEIEKKLKERGIVLKNRLQLNPPSKEYAKILNVTAYDRKTENISMIQERSRGKRKAAAVTAVQQYLN